MIKVKKIKVNSKLFNFINNEVLIDLNVSKEEFWKGFSNIVDYFFPDPTSADDSTDLVRAKCPFSIFRSYSY